MAGCWNVRLRPGEISIRNLLSYPEVARSGVLCSWFTDHGSSPPKPYTKTRGVLFCLVPAVSAVADDQLRTDMGYLLRW
jgi:hypothetical protein